MFDPVRISRYAATDYSICEVSLLNIQRISACWLRTYETLKLVPLQPEVWWNIYLVSQMFLALAYES